MDKDVLLHHAVEMLEEHTGVAEQGTPQRPLCRRQHDASPRKTFPKHDSKRQYLSATTGTGRKISIEVTPLSYFSGDVAFEENIRVRPLPVSVLKQVASAPYHHYTNE